ncbi:MAG TPA: hypothetical protein VK553_00170 [Candidatus Nitrosopolaris rasttigaisensis]|nr:hypothetical protein [Candidatus Nitrosopolaris rasttigaisensis]
MNHRNKKMRAKVRAKQVILLSREDPGNSSGSIFKKHSYSADNTVAGNWVSRT